jgi:phosphatidylserine/phosphatidylglycerophosphate/cardiolipin synthase-like enzyme/regulation of enolase protein 1 (concanavalin A-like superfamily)
MKTLRYTLVSAAMLMVAGFAATAAHAQTVAPEQRLCDPEYQDCRADVLSFINQETVEIDMGFWLMDDARYSNALVAAWQRGVKIRLLMDPRCTTEHADCAPVNDQLSQAGLPMRNRATSGILHWKMALFASQGQVEFAGANYSPFEMVPDTPYQNYTDEIVFFSNDPSIVQSFMSKFDDLWTSTTEFTNYANINGPLTRSYPTYPEDPQLNFPNDEGYRSRAVDAYNAETVAIDVAMFRITDVQETNAIVAAVNRGIPVRLFTDQTEYRNPDRLWDAYNVDIMYHAGVTVRLDDHQGINHEKLVMLRGQGMTIFGSSNWTSPSTDSQREHNMFTTQPWIFSWAQNQFNRKWTNGSGYPETQPFTPLPPDAPVYNTPSNGATGIATSGTSLSWNGGLWGQIYDIYFGTTPTPPLVAQNQQLGPSQSSTDYRTYALPALQPGTTYYWQIVSKTMAYVTEAGPVWSFTTAGTAVNDIPPTVSITSPVSGATYTAPAAVTITATASDSDGTVARVDFYAGNTLLGSSTTSPYSFTWNNVPAGTYSLTAVATDNANATTTSSPVSITVGGGASTLPSGWANADVGATGANGSSSYSNGTFTVQGAGADVWGTADAFQYAYLPLSGDGSIQARVATISSQAAWVKAGVMIRGSLSAGSAQAFMLASYSKGMAFQRRTADGNTSVSTSGSTSTAPRWVKLTRAGNLITAYESPDGSNWTVVGSDSFTMPTNVLVGLAVSSHIQGTLATATFDNVTTSATPNPPSVSITSPSSGATYTAPASIPITASASSTTSTISRVDFYNGGALIGSSSASPYGITWSNVAAGTYSLTAVATDASGVTGTSAAVSVTVTAPTNNPPAVSITSPANNATFTAPATVTITANASDSDGTIAKVDFYAGTTHLGTVTSSPYSFTWSSVAAGTYSLTAVATDNGGASTTSSAVSITVNTGGGSTLPQGWSDSDVGNVGAAGSASYSNGTFTVRGSGADVWGTADAFNYAYLPLSGDGTIVARVATVSAEANWVKAGVMIRESLDPSAAQAFMLVSHAKGIAFQRRVADGNTSVSTSGSTATAPHWVKLVRAGNLITAYESNDGSTWTTVGSDTFTMATNALVGLAVSSHVAGTLSTATFDNVSTSAASTNQPPTVSITSPANNATFTPLATIPISANAADSDGTVAQVAFYANSTLIGTSASAPYSVTWTNVPPGSYSLTAVATDNGGATTTSAAVPITVGSPSSSLPSGWADSDIGNPPYPGSASYTSGTFSVIGSGTDVWGTADQFHYAYTSMTGDRTIIARVASIQNVATWVKAGVMIRETLDAGSTHAFMLVSASKGVAFQRRDSTGGTSVSTAGSTAAAPHWVKLVRAGNTFTAYESADGTNWTLVGTDTISMQSTVYVGLAVTSHTTSASATCAFDNVTIQ